MKHRIGPNKKKTPHTAINKKKNSNPIRNGSGWRPSKAQKQKKITTKMKRIRRRRFEKSTDIPFQQPEVIAKKEKKRKEKREINSGNPGPMQSE